MFAINQEAFDTFFYWINERESIRQKREAGLPKPWSEDTIFQEWKFCNVFRQYDKQSRWLLENVIMPEHSLPSDDGLLLFNIYAFRAFNWYETYDLLRDVQTGWIQWNENNAKYILSNLVNSGHKLTSGAYMIRGVQGRPKYESIPEVLTRIWEVKDNLASAIGSTDHLSVAYDILLE